MGTVGKRALPEKLGLTQPFNAHTAMCMAGIVSATLAETVGEGAARGALRLIVSPAAFGVCGGVCSEGMMPAVIRRHRFVSVVRCLWWW